MRRSLSFSLVLIVLFALLVKPFSISTAAPQPNPNQSSSQAGLAASYPPESAQGPSGPAGYIPGGGYNTELVRQIGGRIESEDVQGSLAYLGIGHRMAILNISDPASPELLAKTPVFYGTIHAVAVAGNYAYLAEGATTLNNGMTRSGGGLRIVDVSNPLDPIPVGFFDTPGNPYDLDVAGNIAYIADSDGGLQMVDVSNPLAPIKAGSYLIRNLDDIVVSSPDPDTGKVTAYFVKHHMDWGIVSIDVTDPAHPVQLSFIEDEEPGTLWLKGKHLYFTSDEIYFRILDVSDPAHPVETARMPRTTSFYYAYLSDGHSGSIIYDIADPTQPFVAGSSPLSVAHQAVASGSLVYQVHPSLEILDLSNPLVPTLKGFYEEEVKYDSAEIQGSYLFTSGSALRIYDISTPASPRQVGYLDVSDTLMAVVGKYAYLADLGEFSMSGRIGAGLRLVDISDPAAPVEAGYYTLTIEITGLAVLDNYVYLSTTGTQDNLRILDVSNPASILQLGALSFPSNILDIGAAASQAEPGKVYAYLADYDNGVRVIDVSDPQQPVGVALFKDNEYRELGIQGDILYAATSARYSDLIAIDISIPTDPVMLDWIGGAENAYPYEIEISGDYLYLAQGFDGLYVYFKDVKNWIENYRYSGNYQALVRAMGVAASGDFIYLAAEYDGLFVIWFGPSTNKMLSSEPDSVSSAFDAITYSFPAGTFSQNADFEHQPRYPGSMAADPNLKPAGHFFENRASSSGNPVSPAGPYTLQIEYSEAELGGAEKNGLALYAWDGEAWVKEPTSAVDASENLVTATPDHFGLFGLFTRSYPVYLPVLRR